MTTRLYLARHGATQLTAEDRFSGGDGVELSDDGRWQATRLGERLRDQHIDAIYCSPYTRTRDTARLIAEQLDDAREIATRDGLREISHGHWEGLARREVESRFADEYTAWESDPFTFAPEGGESGKATIRLLLCGLLGVDARGYRDRFDQAPACLNVLDFRDPVRARLMLFNDTSHYVGQPRHAEQNLSRWWDRGGA